MAQQKAVIEPVNDTGATSILPMARSYDEHRPHGSAAETITMQPLIDRQSRQSLLTAPDQRRSWHVLPRRATASAAAASWFFSAKRRQPCSLLQIVDMILSMIIELAVKQITTSP